MTMTTDKRLRQRQNRTGNMPGPNAMQQGMAVPPHIAAQLLAQQQEAPPHDEQRRNLAVQLAINSFNTEPYKGQEPFTNDELAVRTKIIDDLIAGTHEVYDDEDDDGEPEGPTVPDLGALVTPDAGRKS